MCYQESRLPECGFAYEGVGADSIIIRLGFINVTWEEVTRSIFFSKSISTAATDANANCLMLFTVLPLARSEAPGCPTLWFTL